MSPERTLQLNIPGLRFTTRFSGYVPIQASGTLGAEHFYFRWRGHVASLEVGQPSTALNAQQKLLSLKSLSEVIPALADEPYRSEYLETANGDQDVLAFIPQQASQLALASGEDYSQLVPVFLTLYRTLEEPPTKKAQVK